MYQQNFQQPQMMVQQPMQVPAQNGFVSVRSEMEARNYPVAPGNSVLFKDENQPYIYVKAMGYSQLDRPTFEKYRLVKEETEVAQMPEQPTVDLSQYVLRSDLDPIMDQINEIKKELSAKPARRKREVEQDD